MTFAPHLSESFLQRTAADVGRASRHVSYSRIAAFLFDHLSSPAEDPQRHF
jgi:hypothetical protein